MQVAVEEVTQEAVHSLEADDLVRRHPLLPRIRDEGRLAARHIEASRFCRAQECESGQGHPDSLQQLRPAQRILLLRGVVNLPMRGCVSPEIDLRPFTFCSCCQLRVGLSLPGLN